MKNYYLSWQQYIAEWHRLLKTNFFFYFLDQKKFELTHSKVLDLGFLMLFTDKKYVEKMEFYLGLKFSSLGMKGNLGNYVFDESLEVNSLPDDSNLLNNDQYLDCLALYHTIK